MAKSSAAAPRRPSEQAALVAQRARDRKRSIRKKVGFWRSLGRDNRLFPRKLVVTRDGRWMIGIAILLGVGAVNTGNNLMYLVLSLLISIISISGALSELDLRGLAVKRHHVRELALGEASVLRSEVHNNKSRAALHVEVDEVVDTDELEMRAGLVLHLAAQEVGSCFTVVRPLRRGPIASAGIRVSTTYPFGFARKSIVIEEPSTFLVLPEVAVVDLGLRGGGGRGELERSPKAGQGTELRGLRDFRPGDANRDLHWKVSARRGRMIAREWEAEAARVAWVDFVHLSPLAAPGPEAANGKALDVACATVAGVCAALLELELVVGLRTLQGLVEPAAAGDGTQLLQLRRQLAWLSYADQTPPMSWPLDDDAWLARVYAADAVRARVATSQSVAFAAGEGRAAGERIQVVFASRAAVTVLGAPPTLRVVLDDDGALLRVERVEQAAAGEAA